jgi:periplasmic protein TonB
MESPSSSSSSGSLPRVSVLPASRRVPFPERRRRARQLARERNAARVRAPLSAVQQTTDPLARGRISAGGRALRALGALVGSSAVHLGVVGLGILLAGFQAGRRQDIRQPVDIQVREREPPPPPPPPPEEKPPEPEPPVVKKPSRPPPVAKAEPPPPPEPVNAPPPRVVGLSLESTTEGGGGPAFAVGNTREGQTAERAADPKEVPPEAPPAAAPATVNQVARRIPTAGVVYTQPKRRQPSSPPYPETLKAQGIEADVTVMVRLSAEGTVEDVKVIKEAPYPEFNEAARAHALTESYEPATRDGVPIAYSLSFTYRFRLQEE